MSVSAATDQRVSHTLKMVDKEFSQQEKMLIL